MMSTTSETRSRSRSRSPARKQKRNKLSTGIVLKDHNKHEFGFGRGAGLGAGAESKFEGKSTKNVKSTTSRKEKSLNVKKYQLKNNKDRSNTYYLNRFDIKDLRTQANNSGISCKDIYGKYISKKGLISKLIRLI